MQTFNIIGAILYEQNDKRVCLCTPFYRNMIWLGLFLWSHTKFLHDESKYVSVFVDLL